MDNEYQSLSELMDENKKLQEYNNELQRTINALRLDVKSNLDMIERQEKIIQKAKKLANTPSDYLAETNHSTVYNVEIVLKALKEIVGDNND